MGTEWEEERLLIGTLEGILSSEGWVEESFCPGRQVLELEGLREEGQERGLQERGPAGGGDDSAASNAVPSSLLALPLRGCSWQLMTAASRVSRVPPLPLQVGWSGSAAPEAFPGLVRMSLGGSMAIQVLVQA